MVAERQKNGVVGGIGRDVIIAAATDCIAHAFDVIGKAAVPGTIGSFGCVDGGGRGGPKGPKGDKGPRDQGPRGPKDQKAPTRVV